MARGNVLFFNYYFINFSSTITINNRAFPPLFCNFLVILYHCVINSVTFKCFAKPG